MPAATDLELDRLTDEQLEDLQLRIELERLERRARNRPPASDQIVEDLDAETREFMSEAYRRMDDPNTVMLTPDEFLKELDAMWAKQDAESKQTHSVDANGD